jgi:hypothetical protein
VGLKGKPPKISNRCLYLNGRASGPGGCLCMELAFFLAFLKENGYFLGLLFLGRSAKNGRGVAYLLGGRGLGRWGGPDHPLPPELQRSAGKQEKYIQK